MSYILEALKKSECERGHGAAPSVQTIHSASLHYKKPQRSLWPFLLIGGVALNLVVLIYFIFSDDQAVPVKLVQQQQLEQEPQNNTAIQAPATVTQTAETAAPEVELTATPGQAEAIEIAATQYDATATTETYQVVSIHDLPVSVQRQIPAMIFSAHVYSSNATQRSVVINDRFMEEGEELTNGIVLSEITRDGIIFDYMGYRISTSVITNWDIN